MGAILNAPLAALLAVVEITASVHIIYPAMLAIVIAVLTYSELFKQKSAHQTVLRQLNLDIRDSALDRLLRSTNVTRVMSYSTEYTASQIDYTAAQTLLKNPRDWHVITDNTKPLYVVNGERVVPAAG